jgi:hypothetical protein
MNTTPRTGDKIQIFGFTYIVEQWRDTQSGKLRNPDNPADYVFYEKEDIPYMELITD